MGGGIQKWNKNRLMMELVSQWGSPRTSEAPHSLAYPSPVKRRGHHTSLSLPRLQRQTDSLLWLITTVEGGGGAGHLGLSKGKKVLVCSQDDRRNPLVLPPHPAGAATSSQPGVQKVSVVHRCCFVSLAAWRSQCGSWLLLCQKPHFWTSAWLRAAV